MGVAWERHGMCELALIWRMRCACVLRNKGYRHTLRICNNYCSTATMIKQKCLNVTFIRTLPALLMLAETRRSKVIGHDA
jgi:hypothetical protein